jgi:hypothetical protein
MQRLIDFNLKPLGPQKRTGYVTVDVQSGPCSLPLKLGTYWSRFDDLCSEDQAEILRTRKKQPSGSNKAAGTLPETVLMLSDDEKTLGHTLESWAVEYSMKFSRSHSPRHPIADGFMLGMLFVIHKLPEARIECETSR